MSETGRSTGPEHPGEVPTPEAEEAVHAGRAREAPANPPGREEEQEEVYEDASDNGEILFKRREPVWQDPHPPRQWVSTAPRFKPEDYDGTTSWTEYQMYFDQLAELSEWDDEKKAMILGLCLKGEARMVLAGLDVARRHSYLAVTTALAQNFAPKELVHLHQAELKARKKKREESMTDLGRDIARLVRLAYPTADLATREVIGINAFLEALPGPASEMKLHVIKGRPRSLQEAVAHATEVDAVVEAESMRSGRRRGEVRMVGGSEEDASSEVVKLKKELDKTLEELKRIKSDSSKKEGKRSAKDFTCYTCGEKGHMRRNCPKAKEYPSGQGNESRRLEKQ